MSVNDIIEGLKEIESKLCPSKYESETSLVLEEAMDKLNLFIPKQVEIENGFVKCPTCNKIIRYPIIRYNNCPMCGQTIIWYDSEDEE